MAQARITLSDEELALVIDGIAEMLDEPGLWFTTKAQHNFATALHYKLSILHKEITNA